MPPRYSPKSRLRNQGLNNASGMTLVELLVAIGIVALLAVIAIIVVPKSIERSHTTKCTSNLRQLYVGLELFTQENNGNFPSKTNAGVMWQVRLAPYVDVTLPPNTTAGAPPCQDSIFLCPSVYHDPQPQRSYALNHSLNDNNQKTDDLNIRIRQPDQTAIIGDGLGTSWLQWANNLSYRHEGQYTNVLFADGHVETLTKAEVSSKTHTVFISGF